MFITTTRSSSSFLMRVLVLFMLMALVHSFDSTDISQNKSNISKKLDFMAIAAETLNLSQKKPVLRSTPTDDLGKYLLALRRVIKFCKANKNDIDMNFAFGLFLINVNLKAALRDYMMTLSKKNINEIIDLIKTNNKLLTFYYDMVKLNTNPKDKQNKFITTLFWNDTTWVQRVVPFEDQTTKLHLHGYNRLELAYHRWENYLEAVFDWSVTAIPGPRESDRCMASLVENNIRVFQSIPACNLNQNCYPIIVNGSDFGYSLSHRLLMLVVAHYGRGCSIFSLNTDRDLIKRFCNLAFAEGQYIALNNYGFLIDLLMEQITFCSLEGHKEFLKRSWLQEILKYQQEPGCFGVVGNMKGLLRNREPKQIGKSSMRRKWTMAKNTFDHDIVGGKCNGHLTGVAAAAISSAVRYILSTSYNENNFKTS